MAYQLDKAVNATEVLKEVLKSSSALCRGLVVADEKIGQESRDADVGCAAYFAIEGSMGPIPEGEEPPRVPNAAWEVVGKPICSMHKHLDSGPEKMREALVSVLPLNMRALAPSVEVVEEAARCAKPFIQVARRDRSAASQ